MGQARVSHYQVNVTKTINSPPKGGEQSPQASATPKRFRLRRMAFRPSRAGIWTPLSCLSKRGLRRQAAGGQPAKVVHGGASVAGGGEPSHPQGSPHPCGVDWRVVHGSPEWVRRPKGPPTNQVSIEHIELVRAKTPERPYPCGFRDFLGVIYRSQVGDVHITGQ